MIDVLFHQKVCLRQLRRYHESAGFLWDYQVYIIYKDKDIVFAAVIS